MVSQLQMMFAKCKFSLRTVLSWVEKVGTGEYVCCVSTRTPVALHGGGSGGGSSVPRRENRRKARSESLARPRSASPLASTDGLAFSAGAPAPDELRARHRTPVAAPHRPPPDRLWLFRSRVGPAIALITQRARSSQSSAREERGFISRRGITERRRRRAAEGELLRKYACTQGNRNCVWRMHSMLFNHSRLPASLLHPSLCVCLSAAMCLSCSPPPTAGAMM